MNNKIIQWCKGCTTPTSRPRIEFNDDGYCNACQNAQKKTTIDWEKKEKQFKEYIAKKISENPTREYDCIIPVSGGKDSHLQVWYAKNILNLSVLAVAVEPLLPKDIGLYNRDNLAKSIGVDLIVIKANPQVYAKLTSITFKEYGNPYIPFLYLVFSACAKVAIEKNIPLFLYGENGETEYGGSTSELYSKLDGAGIHARILGNSGCPTPDKWAEEFNIESRDLIPYQEPSAERFLKSNVTRLFMSDHIAWNNNYALNASLNIIGGFKTDDKRTCGSYTFGYGIDDKIDDLYIWLMWPKFGYHRTSKYAAKDIREGKLSYKGACELVRLYDGEFPWDDFKEILEVLDITEDQFWDIAKQFISDKSNPIDGIVVWEKIAPNKWKHLNTIHGEDRYLEIPVKNNIQLRIYCKSFR